LSLFSWCRHEVDSQFSGESTTPPRVHADRTPRRDRDHRDPDRPAAPGRAEGPRGGRPDQVHEQPQADRVGHAQLPRRERLPAEPRVVRRKAVLPRPPLIRNDSNVRDASGNEAIQVTRNSYVAIAGAVDRLDAAGVFRETRNTDSNSWSIDFGITGWGGMIVPAFSRVTLGGVSAA